MQCSMLEYVMNGNVLAMNKVGECYFKGDGICVNRAKACEWFEKAAERNDPHGVHNLGMCYYEGAGVEKDTVKAEQLFQKAKELGWTDQSSECLVQ